MTAYIRLARIETKHSELCLLHHRNAYEQRWLRNSARTFSFQVRFTIKTKSHLYLPDDGLQALARSHLTATSCQEPATRSQQPASRK